MVNYSNLSSPFIPPNQALSFSELVSDYCNQLDHKILIMFLIIFSLYVLRVFMLPRAYEQMLILLPGIVREMVNPYFDRIILGFISFLDTGALVSMLFIFYIFWKQAQFTTGLRLWLIGLFLIVLLCIVANVIDRFKGKGFKK